VSERLTARAIAIRAAGGIAPVVIVCFMLTMDRWPGQLPDGQIVQITNNRFFEGLPSLSPEGEWLAYRCDERGNADICVSTADGREVRNLTLSSADDDSNPAVSPDGTTIAFDSAHAGVSLVSRHGGTIKPLTESGERPAWSPDGRFIIYSVRRPLGFTPGAAISEGWSIEVATGLKRRVSAGDFHHPAVSPGNRRIAYWGRPINELDRRRLAGTRSDLWTIPLDGGAPVRATDAAASEASPMWSPDGRFLYYVSNRNGSSGIWRVRINERTGRVRGIHEPVKTPYSQPVHITRSADGRRFAWSDATTVQRIMRAVFDSDARRTRGTPVEVTPAAPEWEGPEAAIDLSRPGATPGPSAPADPPGMAFPGYWSPDFKLFAGTASGSIWLYSAETRAYDQFRPGKHPYWLNDGRRLVYSDGGRLFIADAILRISRELLSMPDQQLDHPRLSRDNRHLYYTVAGVDANLWLMNVRSN
jgi:Tol biopolymer transport system component